MPIPKLKLELDDGSGTFPSDITTYVDRKSTWSINPGRQDEFSTIDPTMLTITLNNNAGTFTFGSSSVYVGQPIRLSLQKSNGNFVKVFTGYVTSWPVEWPGGKKVSKVTVTASDRMARFARRSISGPLIAQEILRDTPTVYYPLNEPAGYTTASDQSGNHGPLLTQTGSGPQATFGVTSPPPATATSTGVTLAAGQSFTAVYSTPFAGFLQGMEICFSRSGTPVDGEGLLPDIQSNGFYTVLWTAAGKLQWGAAPLTTSASYNDGKQHHLFLDRSTPANLYVDGVLVGTDPTGSGSYGGPAQPTATGTFAHLAGYYSAVLPSAGRIAAHSDALLNGFAGEASNLRLRRLAIYGGVAATDITTEAGAQTMAAVDLDGDGSLLDLFRNVESAEQGLLFINGAGQVTFQSRIHRYNAASVVTIPASAIGEDARGLGDDQLLFNSVTATRQGGSPQTISDAASIAKYDTYSTTVDANVSTDEEAMQLAAWMVARYSEPKARFASAPIDLLTASNALADSMIDLNISDLITITSLPSQAAASSMQLFVEGWTMTGSDSEWHMDLNTSSFNAIFQVWTLEDPVYGAYDSNPLAL